MNADDIAYLLDLAKSQSDDPHTQVGAVIVLSDNRGSILGSNRLPKTIAKSGRYLERPAKYQWIEHAERDAIYRALRFGTIIYGSDMYLTWFPCVDCARAIVASGIRRLHCEVPDYDHPRWGEDFKVAQTILRAGGVEVVPLEVATCASS